MVVFGWIVSVLAKQEPAEVGHASTGSNKRSKLGETHMAAPLFYLIAVGLGAATIGATATDAKKWTGMDKNSAALHDFYNSRFTGTADCLTAAVSANAPIDACAFDESTTATGAPGLDSDVSSPHTFDPHKFSSAADCLNAAVNAGAPLQSCTEDR
jgi:hypothetical protein